MLISGLDNHNMSESAAEALTIAFVRDVDYHMSNVLEKDESVVLHIMDVSYRQAACSGSTYSNYW